MRRRQLDPSTSRVPDWVRSYEPDEWIDLADEVTEEFRDLAATWGPARARQVRGHARWTTARRAWCAARGIALKDMA